MRTYIFTEAEVECLVEWLEKGKETALTLMTLSRIRNAYTSPSPRGSRWASSSRGRGLWRAGPPPRTSLPQRRTPSSGAAVATLDIIERENLPERARLGEAVMKRFREMMERFELIGDVRGRGLLIGVELVKDRETKEPARAEAMKVCWRAWERGLVMISFGRCGNVLRIAPPLTIREDELDVALGIVEASIKDVAEGRVPDSVLQEMDAW